MAWIIGPLLSLLGVLLPCVKSAPSGFPVSGNGLWYLEPAVNWSTQFLPIGNGYLGAMVAAGTDIDSTQLNIESLWTGGPFSNLSYNGGNHQPSEAGYLAQEMQSIRHTIFSNVSGEIDNINVLTTDPFDYGSYSSAGWLVVTRNATDQATEYARWLDLEDGVMRAVWTEHNTTISREYFCSHPTQACVQYTQTTAEFGYSAIYNFSSVDGLPTPNLTCFDDATLLLRGLVAEPGMTYEILARVQTVPPNRASCSGALNASIVVEDASEAWITWVGGTNYDINAGDAAHNFSFRGGDPHETLVTLLDTATLQTYTQHLNAHLDDYHDGMDKFELNLGQSPDLSHPTDELIADYTTDVGNPYLEFVLFNYGRYLLFSSARGVLPANLQGKWASESSNPWSADYHSNINLQMNYWAAESTQLNVTQSLWNYMEKTWAPRGAETAKVLYNVSRGWVTHDEMNVFGHTGMKSEGADNSAEWADYPESAAWMMIHVWDHFDYGNDAVWWRSQGWPLLKSVAYFNLDRLVEDLHFNDSSLVTSPCNSPEQVPITFGCAHAQQLLWQLFNAVEKGFGASGDGDDSFLKEIIAKRESLDKGLHIGSWGQLQEWKVDMDGQNDTHRHLSHLVGLYPGYAISNYANQTTSLSKEDLLQAAQTSLLHRGNGTGPDGDAGWEKVWRAAAWAQFGNSQSFYHELSYAVERNFGQNLLSLYDPFDPAPIFQIDANLGFPAAVLNALVQAPDVAYLPDNLTVTLLPSLPEAWPSGYVRGLLIRGGISVDLDWTGGKLTTATFATAQGSRTRQVDVVLAGIVVASFASTEGSMKSLTF